MFKRCAVFNPTAVVVTAVCASSSHARELSFEDRVKSQTAIEQVYWNHRIWPKENKTPKPPLSAVIADSQIRARVTDYLKKSNALEDTWRRPITAAQLQAEMERMAAHTKSPDVLRELFAALNNDPFLIAETLARQTLADRLIHSWYASDERFHGDVRRKAEAALSNVTAAAQLKNLGAEYTEITWKAKRADEAPSPEKTNEIALDATEWQAKLDHLPTTAVGSLQEEEAAFVVTAVLRRGDNAVTTATAAWPKRTFDSWWAGKSASMNGALTPTDSEFRPAAVTPSAACVPDTWTNTANSGPSQDARRDHTTVWTGSEMIVWGGWGYANYVPLDSGGRYNPATDSWVPTGVSLIGRTKHAAVWTGSEMIVWGGRTYFGLPNDGGRYNPATDTWLKTNDSAANGPPAPRSSHTAVWTGSEMIVWGGQDRVGFLDSGGRYNPSTDTWLNTNNSPGNGAPLARTDHTAVWTGSEMIVWGGYGSSGDLDSGGRYNPSADTWLDTNNSTGNGAPLPRRFHTAVWTGSEMIVWGGLYGGSLLDGGERYNPSTNSWVATATGGAPAARVGHTAVWTGSEMIVWGGADNRGLLDSGGRYNPATDSWVPTAVTPPTGRREHAAVWTGSEMIVWGGYGNSAEVNTGGRYNPSTDNWVSTSTGGAPAPRYAHTAIWTGSEMIVWGGYHTSSFNDGGRYNPSADTWIQPTLAGAPQPRNGHSAVWTGSEMIVWGGYLDGVGALGDGGRYKPSTDSWVATSTGGNPAPRYYHTAVWTGTEMIVWGGIGDNGYVNTGGRYIPSTNGWIATSFTSAQARASHTAVWTGSEMIVWGGYDVDGGGGHYLDAGARYDLSTDSWVGTTAGGAPAGRSAHTAVWTGSEMIVWGGVNDTLLGDGGRYSPATDSWLATSTVGAPASRNFHTAVWTGDEMIVWGGTNGSTYYHDGGRYCVASCASPSTWYQDQDGDGHGTSTVTQLACDQPTGFVANADDCDDTDASIHPGAAEVCNGVDDNCNGTVDDGGDSLCIDGNFCNGMETCGGVSGCQAGTPVVCTAADQCHQINVCDPQTGSCSNPAKPDGTICDDVNACTVGDTCQAGVCQAAGLRDSDGDGHGDSQCGGDDCNDANGLVWSAPDAVSNLRVPTHNPTTTLTWNGQSAVTGPETLYDVVSGALRIPGGPITLSPADCLQSSTATGFTDTRPNPLPGRGYWYLVRARNSCGIATYGTVQRDASIPACPSAQTCTSASQCPGVDIECGHRTCSTSMCGYSFTAAGTPTSSQVSGDCHRNQCDGAGNTVNAIDNTDVPIDGNQCTDDLCFSGVPSNPPSSFGSACSQSGGVICDGAGSCVTIPQVAGTNPPGGTLSAINNQLLVGFSEAMNPATLTGQTVAGACSGSIQVSLDEFVSCIAFSSAAAAMSGGDTLAIFVAQPGPLVNRAYKIRVTTAAQSALGIPLAETFTLESGFTFASPTDPGTIIQNESGAAAEAEYCAVVFPSTLTVQTGSATGAIFGQIFEAGVTNPPGPSAAVTAQLGYGPPTSNAEYEVEWTWINASFNVQLGNNDEYRASFTAPAPGSYRYAYRFSLDGASSWTYCDSTQGDGGAGSNPGLTFEFETLPVLNVTP